MAPGRGGEALTIHPQPEPCTNAKMAALSVAMVPLFLVALTDTGLSKYDRFASLTVCLWGDPWPDSSGRSEARIHTHEERGFASGGDGRGRIAQEEPSY
jgi:hypothetical protein